MNVRLHHALHHTTHCLVGCGIGETLGSAIGATLHIPNLWQTALAVLLAFCFGYGLTFRSARKDGAAASEARAIALRTDTISIISMEVIDNTIEWLIPGAINAPVISWLFWGSMAVALGVAFSITVPVNYLVAGNSSSQHMHH